jgi:hypothetical protein
VRHRTGRPPNLSWALGFANHVTLGIAQLRKSPKPTLAIRPFEVGEET